MASSVDEIVSYGDGSSFCQECVRKFPGDHVAHCATKNHRKGKKARLIKLHPTHVVCNICNVVIASEDCLISHNAEEKHMKKEKALQRFAEFLANPSLPIPRSSWKTVLHTHENFKGLPLTDMLVEFMGEAHKLVDRCAMPTHTGGEVLQRMFNLMVYLRDTAVADLTLTKKIRMHYKRLQDFILGAEETNKFWVLEHNIPKASGLLQNVCNAPTEVLDEYGIWVVKDIRRFVRSEGRHSHLTRLMSKSHLVQLQFDCLTLGASPRYETHNENGSLSCDLHNFIVSSLALEKVIMTLMATMMGSDADFSVFVESLVYCIPEEHQIYYAPDVDINRHERVKDLMFDTRASLVDDKIFHLRRCTRGGEEDWYDMYEFAPTDVNIIKIGDSKMASALTLVDDGFGECVKKWCAGQCDVFLRIIDGVNKGSIIASMFGSRTSVHVEDALLSTFNFMLIGTPKIWYIVPKRHSNCFRQYLVRFGHINAVISKNCFVEALANKGVPMKIMKDFEIVRLVQTPGTIVMSVLGEIYHWTISCGFNLVETSNFFTRAGGKSLQSLESWWLDFRQSGGNIREASHLASVYFRMCSKFGVL